MEAKNQDGKEDQPKFRASPVLKFGQDDPIQGTLGRHERGAGG